MIFLHHCNKCNQQEPAHTSHFQHSFSKSHHLVSPTDWVNLLFSRYFRQYFDKVFHHYMSHSFPAFYASSYVAQLCRHFKASAYIMCANILLAKVSHMAKP